MRTLILACGLCASPSIADENPIIDMKQSPHLFVPKIVKGHIEKDEHSEDIKTLRFVVEVIVPCVPGSETISADNFSYRYDLENSTKDLAKIQLVGTTPWDLRNCGRPSEKNLRFTLKSRNNTTNRASAPKAFMINDSLVMLTNF